MEDYYSDWDYYSDDYYDDDPSVKQSGAVSKEENTGTKTRRTHPGPHRNKRTSRPHAPKPDVTSFQGVIWKTANLERDQDIAIQIYEPGHGGKVALLENWREIFKSVQPALDKSRLRKRKAMVEIPVEEVSFAEEFPCDGDDRFDSSDQSSDVDHMDESGDVGDASNTTPELGQSPKTGPSPMVVVPVKRGRKRKAEAPPEELDKDNPGRRGGVTKTRARCVASEKREGANAASTSSAPVRRSTRQKK